MSMGDPRHFRQPESPVDLNAATHPVWQELQAAARRLATEELTDFLASLEKIRVLAFARLVAPAPVERPPDELLCVAEAARRLGVSRHFLHHHHRRLPFSRKIGRTLRFSAKGIEKYIQCGGVPGTKRPRSTAEWAP